MKSAVFVLKDRSDLIMEPAEHVMISLKQKFLDAKSVALILTVTIIARNVSPLSSSTKRLENASSISVPSTRLGRRSLEDLII